MSCDALTGPEVYYQVVSRAAGTLHITLTSFEPLGLYALSGMCTDGALGMQIACSYQSATSTSRGRIQSFSLETSAEQSYTVVVDSPMGPGQPFALTVTHESNCGTVTATIPTGTRTCGDRNMTAGDGCSSTCTIESGVVLSSCPSLSSVFTPIIVGSVPIVLEGRWSDGGGMAICGPEHSRGERIYALTVTHPSDLRLELDPASRARVALSVRRSDACTSAMGEQCANILDQTAAGERIDVRTTMANERLWLIADSDTDTGYELRIIPRNCGDAILGPEEECDDGNNGNGDGCDSMCRIEARCDVNESTDSTLSTPTTLPSDCGTVRFSGAINPMGRSDLDDAARMFLRAGELVRYQLASGAQGQCPSGVDPVLEISRGSTASIPMVRNNQCIAGLPSICHDDAATYCPEGVFAAPADDWYTFRIYRFQDSGAMMRYQLLLIRR
jgi:cysteine-rich repeat protein